MENAVKDHHRWTSPLLAPAVGFGYSRAVLTVEQWTVDRPEGDLGVMQLPDNGIGAGVPELVLRVRIGREPSGDVELYLNDNKTDEDSLRRQVADIVVPGDREPVVLLSVGKGVEYREVVRVIDLLTSLGLHKVSLESRRVPADAGSDKTSDDGAEPTPDKAADGAGAPIDGGEIEVEPEQNTEVVLPDTFEGSEIIARVGSEEILASDVLPDANRYLEGAIKRAAQPPSADGIERRGGLTCCASWSRSSKPNWS